MLCAPPLPRLRTCSYRRCPLSNLLCFLNLLLALLQVKEADPSPEQEALCAALAKTRPQMCFAFLHCVLQVKKAGPFQEALFNWSFNWKLAALKAGAPWSKVRLGSGALLALPVLEENAGDPQGRGKVCGPAPFRSWRRGLLLALMGGGRGWDAGCRGHEETSTW